MDADQLVRKLDRRQRRLLIGVSGLVALLLLVIAGMALYWRTYLLGPSAGPITRGPYLVRVEPTRAVLRWRAERPVTLLATDPSGAVVAAGTDGVIEGLVAGTTYAWTASVDGAVAAGGSFRTPPAGDAVDLTFTAFADYGAGGDAEWAVGRLAAAQDPDLAVAAGDNSYLFSTDRLLDRNIFRPLGELLRHAPMYPVLGTPHDTVIDGGRAIREAFDFPLDGRYVVRHGGVEFIFLGVNADDDEAFLRDLFTEPPPARRFVVVHEVVQSGDPILPLLRDAGVEAIIGGNLHRYERLDADGIPVFIVGTGGAPQSADFTPATPGAAASMQTFGLLRVDVGATGVRYRFIDAGGVERDRLETP